MPETVQAFLDDIATAAAPLEEPALTDLIRSVQEQSRVTNLNLLIVGSPGSGRASLANLLCGRPDLLPSSPVPKRALPLTLRFGETLALEARARGGLQIALPADRLRGLLIGPSGEDSTYEMIEVRAPAALLKTAQLRIDTIGVSRAQPEWKEVLAGSDFTLLVLRAPALLSREEQDFIAEILNPYAGFARVVIVLNQLDLVPVEERAALVQRLRDFLGPFESEPAVVEISAGEAVRALRAGAPSPESGYDDLLRLIWEGLMPAHRELKTSAVRRGVELCLSELEQAATRHQALLGVGEADIERLQRRLASQSEWLQTRIERAQLRVDAFINTLVKEQLLREVEAFSQAFKRELPAEADAIADVASARRYLSEYIEAVWNQFFESRLATMRGLLADELREIAAQIDRDLQELAGAQADGLQGVMQMFDPTPASMRTFWMPRRREHGAGSVATAIQVGGLVMLIFPGGPVLGLASIAAGHLLRLYSGGGRRADRQALVDAAMGSWEELERLIKRQVEQRFSEISQELRRAVAAMYDVSRQAMGKALEQAADRRRQLRGTESGLERLLDQTIPELTYRMNQIAARIASA
ncbi:MAG: hypothetical protein ACR2PL_28160 [Dehalococcoidia bacterium]